MSHSYFISAYHFLFDMIAPCPVFVRENTVKIFTDKYTKIIKIEN